MIPYYQVQAFTRDPFGGNPAGVCPLTAWLPDERMQQIAREIGLSETAFLVPRPDGAWDLRWFTPAVEVDLCGHATLASAHVLWRERGLTAQQLVFHTRSGRLAVVRDEPRLVLDLPSRPAAPCSGPADLAAILGAEPVAVARGRDLLVELADERTIRELQPDIAAIARLDEFGIAVTARGRDVDFVSRFFAPREGIAEDPVTGSAHCTLAPWWAARLGRSDLVARQVSARSGELRCRVAGERVFVGGEAVTWLAGELRI